MSLFPSSEKWKKKEEWRFPYLFKEKKKSFAYTIFLQSFRRSQLYFIYFVSPYMCAYIMINLFIVGESDLIRVGVVQLLEEK